VFGGAGWIVYAVQTARNDMTLIETEGDAKA
jgi:hypothetical protein